MKMKSVKLIFAFLMVLVLASFTSTESDCRNFKWGSSETEVKAKEKSNYIGEKSLIHNLRGLTFIDYQKDGIYLHTYVFHNGGLYGLKTRKSSLSGNDTKLNALHEYDEMLKKYSSYCIKDQLVEVNDQSLGEQGLKCFQITYPNKTVFVSIEKELNTFNKDFSEYYLTETTMKKGLKKI